MQTPASPFAEPIAHLAIDAGPKLRDGAYSFQTPRSPIWWLKAPEGRSMDQAHTEGYDQAACGLISLDDDLAVVSINQTLLNWLGWERSELTEPHGTEGDLPNFLTLAGLLDPVSGAILLEHVRSTRQEPTPVHAELRLYSKDGRFFTAELSSVAQFDPQGDWLHTQTCVIDVTERAETQHRIRARLALLQTITDRTPSRLAYYDENLICCFSNAAHARGHGKSPSELVGMHISEIVSATVLPDILPKVAKVLSGETLNFEAERPTRGDGSEFYEIRYLPDLQNGRVVGFFVELINITERRRTEDYVFNANLELEERVAQRTAELHASEQRYRLMSEAIRDYGIAFLDAEGAVSEWTESAQRLLQTARGEAVGRALQVLVSGADGGIDLQHLLAGCAQSGHADAEGWAVRRDGSRFWCGVTLTALRNARDEPQGYSCVLHDLSDAKQLADLLSASNASLQQRVDDQATRLAAVNKDLAAFSYTIAHDLRAPLRHIAQFVDLSQELLDPARDNQLIQMHKGISNAQQRMGLMLEGLLEYSRLGRAPLDIGCIPLSPLVKGVAGHLMSEAAGRRIEWVIDAGMPNVRGDPILLGEVFGKLLDNAVKFTRKTPDARIEVGAQPGVNGRTIVFVKDNGVGFDLQRAKNLFVMFQRQHHSMDHEGVGTGLALVHRIVERHGGKVWCEAEPDKGCTFYLDLPAPGADDYHPDIET